MTAAAQKLEFSGISWAEIALNEHAMRLDFDRNGRISYVNRLFCEQTGIAEAAWLDDRHWKNRLHFLEGGREVDLGTRIRFGQTWRGLVSILNGENEVYLTHATAVPCMDLDENLLAVTLLISPTDMTRTSASPLAEVQEPALETMVTGREQDEPVRLPGRPAPLGAQPADVEWPGRLFALGDTIQAGEDQFFTLVLQGAASIPRRFRISAQVFSALLPALLRTSTAATQYGVIHVSMEPVTLTGGSPALRVRVEDTGDRFGTTIKDRPGSVTTGRFSELKATLDLFAICDTDLYYRSEASGNQYEFLAAMEVLVPARKGDAAAHRTFSYPASPGVFLRNAGGFAARALQELSFSELLSADNPADALQAANWIHSQRPTLYYLGNEEMAAALHRFEKQLRNNPPPLWREQYERYRSGLLDWIRIMNSTTTHAS